MCKYLLWCLALDATSLRKQKYRFYPPEHNVSFRTYWCLLAGIRVILTVNRIILTVNRIISTENCYSAPWGNVAVSCGFLDDLR